MIVRIIIPTQLPNGKDVGHLLLHDYKVRIAAIAGGYTSTSGEGGWKNDKGVLTREPILIVDISISDNRQVDALRTLAGTICEDLEQDCVFFQIDNEVEYVKCD